MDKKRKISENGSPILKEIKKNKIQEQSDEEKKKFGGLLKKKNTFNNFGFIFQFCFIRNCC